MPDYHEEEPSSDQPQSDGMSLLPDPSSLTASEGFDGYHGPRIIVPGLGGFAQLELTHDNPEEMFYGEDRGAVLTSGGLLIEDSARKLTDRGWYETGIKLAGVPDPGRPVVVTMRVPGNNPPLSAALIFAEDPMETGPKRFMAFTRMWTIPGMSRPGYFFTKPDQRQLLSQLRFSFTTSA